MLRHSTDGFFFPENGNKSTRQEEDITLIVKHKPTKESIFKSNISVGEGFLAENKVHLRVHPRTFVYHIAHNANKKQTNLLLLIGDTYTSCLSDT